MMRQLPKPVATVFGTVVCSAINGFIYGGGWLCMRWDDLCDLPGRLLDEYRCRRVGARAEQWLKDSAR